MENKDWHLMQFLAPKVFRSSYDKEKDELFITGEAIHATTTRNGTLFTVEELDKSAHTLAGRPLLKDHINSVDSIIGRVTAAKWSPEKNAVMFKAKVTDKAMRQKIRDGDINNVSVGAMVDDIEELEADGKTTYKLKNITFLELSTVAIPADPNAGFGVAQAVTAALQKKNFSPVTTTQAPQTTEEEKVEEEETATEEKTMENTNQNALAEALLKISETLSAQNEKLAALEAKVSEQAKTPVTETPVSTGVVSSVAEENTDSDPFFIERNGFRASISYKNYDKSRFANLGRNE